MLNLNFFYVHAQKLLNEILLFRLSVGCHDPLLIYCGCSDDIVVRDVLFQLNKRVEEDEKYISLLRSFMLIDIYGCI